MTIKKLFKLFIGLCVFVLLGMSSTAEANAALNCNSAMDNCCEIAKSDVNPTTGRADFTICAMSRDPNELQALTTVVTKCEKAYTTFGIEFWTINCKGVPLLKDQVTTSFPLTNSPVVPLDDQYVRCWGGPNYALHDSIAQFSADFYDSSGDVVCKTGNHDVGYRNVTWAEIFERQLAAVGINVDITPNTPNLPENLLCPTGGFNTALGCINTGNLGDALGQILSFSVGIGGGLALLLMGYGVFLITTSAGIPDKVNAGKEIITAAVGGLMLIVLSVVLFRLIGVEILQLPGLQ
jgi:hypothetical protein